MVQCCNLCNAHPPDLQFQGFDPPPCHAAVIPGAGFQELHDFQHGYTGFKIIRLLQDGAFGGQFPMFPHTQAGEMALPAAQLAAVGGQPVLDYLFGVGRKLGKGGVIGDGSMAEPDAALLVQVIIAKAVDSLVDVETLTDNPVDHGEVRRHHFLLLFCQRDGTFHQYPPPFRLSFEGRIPLPGGRGKPPCHTSARRTGRYAPALH